MKSGRAKLAAFVLLLCLLPAFLTLLYWVVPPISTLMLRDIAMLTMPKREWVSLDEMSSSVIGAAVASEDSAFCTHYGFDFKQLEHSVEKSIAKDKPLKATSTITQQTAKNLFLWHGRSWLRKALEVPLTLVLELILPKKRILEIYLNIAEWGPHIYGIEAASQHYFNVSSAMLSAPQAALLIASLPSPLSRNPEKPKPFHQQLARSILTKINQQELSCLR